MHFANQFNVICQIFYSILGEFEDLRKRLLQELWKFNLTTKKWTKLKTSGPVPETVASHTAHFLVYNTDPKLLTFGGTGFPFGHNLSVNINFCDLKSLQWTNISPGELSERCPMPSYGQATKCHGQYFYTVGGTDGHRYTNSVHRYDFTKNEWTCLFEGEIGGHILQSLFDSPAPRYFVYFV